MSWEFRLEVFKNQSLNFSITCAKLGFNPSQRMLWIGKTVMSEDVWVTMVPKTFETDDSLVLEELDAASSGRNRHTHLKECHCKILLAFLAYALESIGICHVYLNPPYPDMEDPGDKMFKTSSPFL